MKKRAGFVFAGFVFAGLAAVFYLNDRQDQEKPEEKRQEALCQETEEIARSYQDIYETAREDGDMGDLETIQRIVDALAQDGHTTVDFDRELNMEHPEKIENLCEKGKKKETEEASVLAVMEDGGLARYDLQTQNGELYVTNTVISWEAGEPKAEVIEEYRAYSWDYTEKGWLFFQRYQPGGFDGDSGCTAFRVQPLSEICREYNRKYIEPVGYGLNQLFITDWSADDYGALDFYDLYEVFYEMKYKEQTGYDLAYEGQIYHVPEEQFQEVFTTFLPVEIEELRERTTYDEETKTYQYRPRGMFDHGLTPYVPVPEVVDHQKNEDGTLTLTVDAVWPEESTEKALRHEVTIQPLENGGFQYISNHVLPSEENIDSVWYVERLTDEEWEEVLEM